MVETIFRQQLPAHGMAVREGQIKLCHAMLDALYNKEVALCDAGVGLGKTYAYLVACLLWQSQRPRALWQPVVISTASVALQEAILQEYIPFLSSVLLQCGYLSKPIQAVLRKGKERFVCDLRLLERQRQMAQRGDRFARRAAILRQAQDCLDLDKLAGLSGFDRRRICVPEHCPRLCPARSRCRYQRYLRESNGPAVSIQVCNHNYLLADALHRQNGWKPLLRDYQAAVIDEAHRLPEAAEQMLTKQLSIKGLRQLTHRLEQQHLTRGTQKLCATTEMLAAAYQPQAPNRARADRQVPYQTIPERQATLAALQTCIGELLQRYQARLPLSLRHQLQATSKMAALFARPQEDWITYIEYGTVSDKQTDTEFTLCAVPRDQPGYLRDLLWQREKPAILTSGTLAAGHNFTHVRRQLGLHGGSAVQTVQVASPFDYAKNCLLLFPLRPAAHKADKPSRGETSHERLARQIEQLIHKAHGHTLVLFTSYDQMGHVYEQLEGRLPVPLFKAPRGGQWFVEQFKRCDNAVLLAGGPCWEGVDFPGDIVSLLVIVRLPFPVPDPVREARRQQYLCYMGANHRVECSGQRAYVAKRVERLVIQVTWLLLDSIRDTPKDASIEKRMKEEIKALSDRVKDAKKKADNAAQEQENLEQEVAKSLMGKSRFNPEMLSRLIEEASQKKKELQRTAIELEQQLTNQKKIAEELSSYYDRFLGWSGEFGMASIERKRMIIAQLYKRIELGRGYKLHFVLDWNYEQFLNDAVLEGVKGVENASLQPPPKIRKRNRAAANQTRKTA